MEKSRNSNYELMRIISMFFIVVFHFFIHTNIITNTSGLLRAILIGIESIVLVHVNSFIVVTGYFQGEKKFKLKKLIKIINQTWFYKVLIMCLLVIIGIIAIPDRLSLFKVLFPIDNNTYWYISSYLILYLISPILNIIINKTNKKEFQFTISILFFIISILSTISKDVYFNSNTGRSLSTFILLYFIGAYLKKYPIEKEKIFKKFKIKNKKTFYFLGYLLLAFLSTISYIIYLKFYNKGPLINDTLRILGFMHISYASPIVIIQTVFYFMFFGNLNISSKLINKISSATLGVYLISENIYIRENLYNKFGFSDIKNVNIHTLLKIAIACSLVFIICIVIDLIRQIIFKAFSKVNTNIKKLLIKKEYNI